jgi:hypothetical protein
MFLNKKATSVIEAVVVLFIVVSWVVWMYQVFWASQKLSNSTANKIQAIQIAREWIEWVKNIRDTNWILYSSDTTNCWNVNNYSNTCVWDNNTTYDIASWSYIIYKKPDNRWYLETKVTNTAFNQDYRDRFKVWLDSDWFFTQTWWTDIKPLFTREIQISYLKSDNSAWDSNDPKMQVISLVKWVDLSSSKPHRVRFKSILTNWKK